MSIPKLSANAWIDTILNKSVALWIVITLIGQWAFGYYILRFYGISTLQGDFEAWTTNKLLRVGYVADDTIGNTFFAAHAILAGTIAFIGVSQLIASVRIRFGTIHRWNGRVFIVASILASLSGIYLVWFRDGTQQQLFNAIAISVNAVLIIGFGLLAWRAARRHDIAAHRRWALRTFIVVNGVWFFRIGLFAWLIVNQGPAGMTKDLTGPFDRFWAIASYLLPLILLELYMVANKNNGHRWFRLVVGTALASFTALMAIGIVALSAFQFRLL